MGNPVVPPGVGCGCGGCGGCCACGGSCGSFSSCDGGWGGGSGNPGLCGGCGGSCGCGCGGCDYGNPVVAPGFGGCCSACSGSCGSLSGCGSAESSNNQSASSALVGEPVEACYDGKWYTGKIVHLEPSGNIRVQLDDGKGHQSIELKDVRPLDPNVSLPD